MSVINSAYEPLLQGATQQNAAARLPGQVSDQLNMTSDLVTGLRRRVGLEVKAIVTPPGAWIRTGNTLRSWSVEVGPSLYHVLHFRGYGLRFYTQDFSAFKDFTDPYIASAPSDRLAVTSLKGELWVANRDQVPQFVTSTDPSPPPNQLGFFWVKSSAFSKSYQINLTAVNGSTGATSTILAITTTPDGTHAGDADLATPSAIASALATNLGGYTVFGLPIIVNQAGAFVSVRVNGNVTISIDSPSGDSFMGVSNKMRVRTVSDLPSTLPAAADQWVVAVGVSDKAMEYYYWDYASRVWKERAAYGSSTAFSNCPRRIYALSNSGAVANLTLDSSNWPGRLSGDDQNNPYPQFVGSGSRGITALGTYQGRLAICTGPYLDLSDAKNPKIFSRSTASDLPDSDFIEISSGGLQAATFEEMAQYNRDLVLFSAAHQAVLPGQNTAVTPRTAFLVNTGTNAWQSGVQPIPVGQWLMFPVPRTTGYTGLSIMYPSQYTASQYKFDGATDHLPTYFPNAPTFLAASASSNHAVLGNGSRDVKVYQYFWVGDEIKQSAWHTWSYPTLVKAGHFMRDELFLFLDSEVDGSPLYICRQELKLRDDIATQSSIAYPYLDMWSRVTWNGVSFSGDIRIAQNLAGQFNLAGLATPVSDGRIMGNPVDLIMTGSTPSLGPDAPTGIPYFIGLNYSSYVEIAAPVMKDKNDRAMFEDGARLMALYPTTARSGEFALRLTSVDGGLPEQVLGGVAWQDFAMVNNRALVKQKETSRGPVQVRIEELLSIQLASRYTWEMCFTNIEYDVVLPRGKRRI